MTLDIAGLAASVFRRGVDYIRVPTTLVGLADVAVGIKQGVNALGKKNVIGTFYPPLASINDYRFAQTLHRREIACGMAEIVKVGLLRDPVLLNLLKSYGHELSCSRFGSPAWAAAEVANRAELLTMEELAPNLFEKDLARLVDFGHTFSPAIETLSRFEIPHGLRGRVRHADLDSAGSGTRHRKRAPAHAFSIAARGARVAGLGRAHTRSQPALGCARRRKVSSRGGAEPGRHRQAWFTGISAECLNWRNTGRANAGTRASRYA